MGEGKPGEGRGRRAQSRTRRTKEWRQSGIAGLGEEQLKDEVPHALLRVVFAVGLGFPVVCVGDDVRSAAADG